MIDKRTLLKYFAASATCSACYPLNAQAQNIEVEGCMLSGASANLMLNTGKLSQSSGNQKVDIGSRNEYNIVSRWTGLKPGFAFFDDSDAPNAMATTQSILGGNHGTILYGKTLLSREMATSGSPAASMIFMHEFAHIIEFNVGVRRINPQLELLADFMAGWYLARVKGTMGVSYNRSKRSPVWVQNLLVGAKEFNASV